MISQCSLDHLAAYDVALTTRFRGLTGRQGLLVRGPAGWGEFAPFSDYTTWQDQQWGRATVEAAQLGFPAPVRERVAVNVTIPAVDPPHAARLVAASQGCTTAKVKVAERSRPAQAQHREDLDRVAAVRDALGPGGKIRIDVNGAWSVEQAAHLLPALDRAARGLEYVEQPCSSVQELAQLRRLVQVPIAADESIRCADDPLRVVHAQAADVLVLKVAPLGGVRACLELAQRCELPVVVSSALETCVGMAAAVALAAALPRLEHACGLATGALLAADVVANPPRAVEGHLRVADFLTAIPNGQVATTLTPEAGLTHAPDQQWLHRWHTSRPRP